MTALLFPLLSAQTRRSRERRALLANTRFFDITELGPFDAERQYQGLMFLPHRRMMVELEAVFQKDGKVREGVERNVLLSLVESKANKNHLVVLVWMHREGKMCPGMAAAIDLSDSKIALLKIGNFVSSASQTQQLQLVAMVRWCLGKINGSTCRRVFRDWTPEQRKQVRGHSSYSGYESVVLHAGGREVVDGPHQPTGIRKCLHEVRAHIRRYKSGKTVIVRSHQRGDANLGTRSPNYKVIH